MKKPVEEKCSCFCHDEYQRCTHCFGYYRHDFISRRELEGLAEKIDNERCIPVKVKLIDEFVELIKEQ